MCHDQAQRPRKITLEIACNNELNQGDGRRTCGMIKDALGAPPNTIKGPHRKELTSKGKSKSFMHSHNYVNFDSSRLGEVHRSERHTLVKFKTPYLSTPTLDLITFGDSNLSQCRFDQFPILIESILTLHQSQEHDLGRATIEQKSLIGKRKRQQKIYLKKISFHLTSDTRKIIILKILLVQALNIRHAITLIIRIRFAKIKQPTRNNKNKLLNMNNKINNIYLLLVTAQQKLTKKHARLIRQLANIFKKLNWSSLSKVFISNGDCIDVKGRKKLVVVEIPMY
ncbi:hypothetical protein CR513_50754, partial [Mucuna pruriens]